MERKIKSLVRWNAMAMVCRPTRATPPSRTHRHVRLLRHLYEIGFNHFFKGRTPPAEGIWSTSRPRLARHVRSRLLEGRLSEQHLKNFRRELAPGGGLSSYPHPWLMPNFWQFPTVSMGLGPSWPSTRLASTATSRIAA